MKILHIIDSGGLYGAEVMLLNLVAEQTRLGYTVEIASIGEKGIEAKPIETAAIEKGFAVRKFRMRPGPNLPGALTVLRHAHQKQFDLLHSHGYKSNILFGLLPRPIRQLPMVATLHGWTATQGFNKMKVYEWLDSISLRFIDTVVLVNRGMRAHPRIRKNGRKTFQVVNNGISPTPDASPATIDPALQAFCEHGYTIGALGRLSAEKGFGYLIEALSILLRQGKDVRLLLLGEGGQRKLLEEKVATLGIGERVRMPGFLPDAARYLMLFQVLAMPSLTEGLPITILEAMRAGVPIAASRVGGIPHVLEDKQSAMLVPASDPAALAEAIALLHDNPAMGQALAATARQDFQQHYTSERMAQAYHRIYARMLGQDALSG
ncbi:MAG: glycosyltransferase [Desulfatitalea sp.]